MVTRVVIDTVELGPHVRTGHSCFDIGLPLGSRGQFFHGDDLVALDKDELAWAARQ